MAARKEVDLRAEEVLEAYCIIMRQNNAKVNLDDEHSVFNLLVKISEIAAEQSDDPVTWSQALEIHFSRNLFKAKALRVS